MGTNAAGVAAATRVAASGRDFACRGRAGFPDRALISPGSAGERVDVRFRLLRSKRRAHGVRLNVGSRGSQGSGFAVLSRSGALVNASRDGY